MVNAIGAVLGQAAGALQGVVGVLQQIAAAAAPAAMKEFSKALEELQASIGPVFSGALEVFADVARELGGVLAPAARELGPMIRSMAEAYGNYLSGAVRALVAVFQVFAPVLRIATDAVSVFYTLMGELVGIVVAAVKAFQTMITAVLGSDTGGFKEAFKGLADVVKQVVKALITLYATLASFFGEDTRRNLRVFADALDKESRARSAPAGGAAKADPATNAGMADVAALLRQAQLAALLAASSTGEGSGDRTDNEWLREIAASVRGAADSRKAIFEALAEWWDKEVMFGNTKLLFNVLNKFLGAGTGLLGGLGGLAGFGAARLIFRP